MDLTRHKKESKEYLKAKEETRIARENADLRLHSEFSKVKYDPNTGSLTEEK